VTVKRIVGWGLVLVVVVGLAALRAKRVRESASAPTVTAAPVEVEVAAVRRASVRDVRHLLGDVVANEETPVAARLLSQVIDVRVREGDRVRSGQVLADLDAREQDDAVAAAEAGVAAAQENLAAARIGLDAQLAVSARDRVLFDATAISREEWDRSQAALAATQARQEAARAQLTVARKSLDSARTRRSYATIVSPFDGVVAARYVDPGDTVAPGKPLVLLLGSGAPRVRVKGPSEEFAALSVGQSVVLSDLTPPLDARIARVFPAMDAAHLATFEVDVPPGVAGLAAGATVGVDLVRATAEGLTVPASAVLDTSSGSVVFTLDRDRAHVIPVRVVARSTDACVVDGPLEEGDEVVMARPSRLMSLAEGTPLRRAAARTASR
jgi:RND family efflux transporter MFP subunit